MISQEILRKHTMIIVSYFCVYHMNEDVLFVCVYFLKSMLSSVSRRTVGTTMAMRMNGTCVCLIAHCCQDKSPMMRHWQGDTMKGGWEKHETEGITSNHGSDTEVLSEPCSTGHQRLAKSIPRFSPHQPSSNCPPPFSTTSPHYLFALGQAYKLIGVTESS